MAITIDGAGTITGLDADGISSQPVFPGNVLQVVRATDSTNRSTTSTSFVDVTGMAVTITPQESTSNIIVIAVFTPVMSRGGVSGEPTNEYQITDSSNTPLSGAELIRIGFQAFSAAVATRHSATLLGYATPASTSAVTYKLRFSVLASGVTNTVVNGINTGQLYAIEVAA